VIGHSPRRFSKQPSSGKHPAGKHCFRGCRLDLPSETISVKGHQGIVCRIRPATNRIRHKDDAKAKIHGVKHRRQNADIGLCSGDHDAIDLPLSQKDVQS
jgi:hypothetical protein